MKLPSVVALLALATAATANDTIQATQTKLAKLGYYGGTADGRLGSQTSAAIRRFQIAENLKVTGELNRQTLERLGIQGSPQSPAYIALSDIFHGGPFASAGTQMQVTVVKQAQQNLKLLGYYKGPENGSPNTAFVAAIKAWQKGTGSRVTGRFDANTLKGLDLMPD